jgi:predicted transport protein
MLLKLENEKLAFIKEKKIDLEKDVQKITEENLDTIFGLKFVSGSLNKEFSVKAQEQDFYIDTLAWNESEKTFVIIEYKKDKSFSVIDQGFAYLSAMLNNQAEFVLELNEKLKKNYKKDDINWEGSRVIFIANEFTNYQKNAINFKDLPMYLYEARFYEGGIVEYDPIKPYNTTSSINKLSHNKIIQRVAKEVKVYGVDDLIKPEWTDTNELYEILRDSILALGQNVQEVINKYYFTYKISKNGQWYNFAELVPQAGGLMVHLDMEIKRFNDPKKILEDCSKVGHHATGNTKFKFDNSDQLEYAISLIEQSYEKSNK